MMSASVSMLRTVAVAAAVALFESRTANLTLATLIETATALDCGVEITLDPRQPHFPGRNLPPGAP